MLTDFLPFDLYEDDEVPTDLVNGQLTHLGRSIDSRHVSSLKVIPRNMASISMKFSLLWHDTSRFVLFLQLPTNSTSKYTRWMLSPRFLKRHSVTLTRSFSMKTVGMAVPAALVIFIDPLFLSPTQHIKFVKAAARIPIGYEATREKISGSCGILVASAIVLRIGPE